MKRIAALVLAITLLSSTPVIAADLDLSSMTTDELVALQDSIKTELNDRGYSANDEIATGVFLVGRDIRAGVFTFEASEHTMINIYDDMEKYNNLDYLSDIVVLEGESGSIALADGQVMEIVSGKGRLTEDKPSWAP